MSHLILKDATEIRGDRSLTRGDQGTGAVIYGSKIGLIPHTEQLGMGSTCFYILYQDLGMTLNCPHESTKF